MNINKIKDKTKLWVEAGIINDSQAQKIFEFEGQGAGRSWGVFGFSIVGLLAIVVGIISLIAANWAEISDGLKLTSYFALQVGLGFACVRFSDRRDGIAKALPITFALCLFAGIGLIGQIYHLESDGLSALRFWLILSAPLALTSSLYLLPRIWFVIFGWALMLWFFEGTGSVLYGRERELTGWYRGMVLLSVVFSTIALGVFQRIERIRPFMQSSRSFGWLVFMGGLVPFTNILWALGERLSDLPVAPVVYPVVAVAAACVLIFRNAATKNEALSAKLLALTLIVGLATFLAPCLFYLGEGGDVFGGLIFVIEFVLAAMAAALLGTKRVFDLLTFIIAVRFIIAYFEVFGSLSLTGVGLIISGLVILGAVLVWSKFRRQIGSSLGVEL